MVEITEIRIKLMEASEDRLRAFCSITIDDCFVVRDLKIIDGTNGPFVAMPSRKLTGHCHRCNHKNHLRAAHCNHCGAKLQSDGDNYDSPQKLYADVAHPINSECRELIQNAVITEFEAELRRSQQPGYRSRYDDGFEFADAGPEDADDAAVIAKLQKQEAKKTKPVPKKKSEVSEKRPAADIESGPRRPHFMDRPDREKTAPQDEDDFGAGVF